MRRSQRPPKPTFWETLKSDFFEYFKLRYRVLTDPEFRSSLTGGFLYLVKPNYTRDANGISFCLPNSGFHLSHLKG